MHQRLLPNTMLSHYRLINRLGAGGMGEVYVAEDTRLDRKVALKLLLEEFVANDDRLRRFVQEAKAAAALNHPNIAHIYEVGETGGIHYIAMEFVDGDTLTAKMHRDKKSLSTLLRYLSQVAEGLAKAHGSGIVHRDLKPDNIMITRDGYAKILDFGLAKLIETPSTSLTSEDAATAVMPAQPMSAAGTVMGTVGYMSPEQAQGKTKQIDQRSDIFSFGCILFEGATGRRPFDGDSAIDTLHKIIYTAAPPVTDFNRDAPTDLQRIIRRCLAKEPDKRYQTIRDVANDLEDLRREIDADSEASRSEPSDSSTSSVSVSQTAIGERDSTISSVQPATTSSAEYLVGEIKRHKVGAALTLTVLLTGIAAIGYFAFFARAQSGTIESIAVMPFVNQSGDADVEYLSDGMTEMLISSLSQLPNLSVKPRSTVFRYKGKDTNPRTIGKELNVQAILNGRVAQRGQDVSLFVELIDVALDKVVWSQPYNRKQTDLVTLQSDIARDVSSKLKATLSGADEAKVSKIYTANPEAYQLYLKGNFYRTKYTEEGYQKGIEYYQKAVAIDPNYALAYHGIAAAYDFANGWYLPPRDSEPKAKAAALKALELDETLAETHYLLGKIVFWYEWDWATAEKEWKRANELDDSYPAVYPPYLAAMGRFDEAIKAQDTVQRRLPLDLNIGMDSASLFLQAGRYDQSIEQSRKVLEVDPSYWWAYQVLGLVYERMKQYPEAIAALEKAHLVDSNPSILGYLGYVYAAAGKKAEAQKVLEDLKESSKHRYVSPYNIAIIYAGLNDKDQAFEWLNKAYEERDYFMTLLKVETVLDDLRPDPRFRGLLQRMKLQE